MKKASVLMVFVVLAAASTLLAPPSKTETRYAVFGPYLGIADVSSSETPVIVGTNTWTYSPELIGLYLSERLVDGTGIPFGLHWGKARCSTGNGPEGSRLDFYFDCTGGEDLMSTCDYRLIVRFGSYDRKANVVVFDLAEMQLYTTEIVQLKVGEASFSVAFEVEEDGSEIIVEDENCRNGKDDDRDALVDCDDPDCDGSKFCP